VTHKRRNLRIGLLLALAISLDTEAAMGQGWIQGGGANLNGVPLDRVHVGFGDRLFWRFASGEGSPEVVLSSDLILGSDALSHLDPALALQLHRLSTKHGLHNATFLSLWVTPEWSTDWYAPREIQRLIDQGVTPVFLDWFFGDRLLSPDAKDLVARERDTFAKHSSRLGRYLGQFDGDILVVVEPELNKPSIEAWPEFGLLLRQAGIAHLKAGVAATNAATGRQTRVFVGTALTDNGLRDERLPDEVYGTKAHGDSYGWTLSRPLLEVLRPDLDFIGFQELIGQFHRNHDIPDQAVAESPESLGLNELPTRIVNYATYLHEQLGLPILIPFIGLATSRWDDFNSNHQVDQGEVIKLGWEEEVGRVWAGVRNVFLDLHEQGVIGLNVMMLFDDPVHDLGGYQYFLQDEYAIGLIATNAVDGRQGEDLGRKLYFKSLDGKSFVDILFGN
jgi:hypothetical protein